jgi:hypothetical protein
VPPAEEQADQSFSQILWDDPKRGPWGIQAMWVEIDGRPECVGLTIWRGAIQGSTGISYRRIPGAKMQRITATGIAELPIATIIDKLREAARDHWRHSEEVLLRLGIDWCTWTLFEEPTPGRPGAPRRYGPDHYVRVAETYLAAWDSGRRPTQAVADEFEVTRTTAAKWIAKARSDELRLLTPTQPGVAGAKPGRALLKHRKGRTK